MGMYFRPFLLSHSLNDTQQLHPHADRAHGDYSIAEAPPSLAYGCNRSEGQDCESVGYTEGADVEGLGRARR